MEIRIEPEYTEKQTKAIRALRKPGPIEVLYGGAKGGGKSHLGCVWMYIEAVKDIQRFNIQPRRNPLCLGFMGRMVGKDFKDTTLETWKREIPENGYQIKGNPPEIIIAGRVKYLTGGLDRRETINKFNSAEYARAFIDQAEETEKEKIRLLRAATHNRLVINGTKIPGKILWTANPRQCWLKTEFIDKIVKRIAAKIKRVFVRALPSDNPYLGEDYVDVLRDIFADRPDLLKAYLLGDWDIMAGIEQIIKNIWIKEAKSKTIYGDEKHPRLVCDTARFGDDECVIDYMETTDIEEEIIMPYCRATEISQKLSEESFKHNDCPIAIEATGSDLGAAVADQLIGQGKQVVIYNPQGRASQPKKYYNQRAEAWALTARKFAKGRIQLKNAVKVIDMDILTEQLCTPTYKFRKSRTIIEAKADIKTRLGRSPDRADCFVIGQWSYDKVPIAEENIDEWGRQTKDEDRELAETYVAKSNF